MRVAPCKEPRAWPRSNCSSTTAWTPRAPSARAVAEPSRPEPTTATSTRSTAATIAGRPSEQPTRKSAGPPGAGAVGGAGLRDEGDLPGRVTGHDGAVGVGGPAEREGLRHEDPQRPVLDEPGQLQPGGVPDLRSRVRARRAAEKLDALLPAARDGGDGGDPRPVGDQVERDVDGLVRAGPAGRGGARTPPGRAGRPRPAGPGPYAPGRGRRSRRNPCRAGLAVATAVAPRPVASCTAISPTPPAPPWIRTVSPSCTSVAARVCQAVTPASISPAAWAQSRASGFGTRAPPRVTNPVA